MTRIFWLFAALLLGLIFTWCIGVWNLPLDPDYTAGELYDTYLAWRDGRPLYGGLHDPPYRVLNYPPGFFWLVRPLAALIPALYAGRLVALLAALAGIGLLYCWGKRSASIQGGGVATVAVTCVSFPVFFYAVQFHFQWVAVALSLAGAYATACAAHRRTICLAAVCCTLACFLKQTQCVTLLIVAAWLWRYRRPWCLPYLVTSGIVGSVGLLLLQWFHGSLVWDHLLIYTVGQFSRNQFAHVALENLLPLTIFLFTAGWYAYRHPEARRDLRWWYLCGSLVWVIGAARLGSGPQYYLEFACALGLWVGPWGWQYLREAKTPMARAAAALLAIQWCGTALLVGVRLERQWQRTTADAAMADSVCRVLPPPSERIVGEVIGLIRYCGHEPALQPFIMANLTARRLWDETPLLNDLRAGRYPALLLTFDPASGPVGVAAERWSPAVIAAMAAAYRQQARIGRYYIFHKVPGTS